MYAARQGNSGRKHQQRSREPREGRKGHIKHPPAHEPLREIVPATKQKRG